MMAFSASLSFDKRLAPSDIEASIAHVHGLGKAGILQLEEVDQLVEALSRTGDELAAAVFEFQPGDEDIHTAIERRVRELAGDVGAKLHTGRSRNDQVATALRLYTRENLSLVAGLLIEFQRTLQRRATEAGHTYLPGYTHLQRAQPVLLAHHLLAHGWALARDVDRLFATLERLNVSPLGAGALAGSSLPLVPDEVAAELAMTSRFENSLDAVSDRDFVAEALFDIALIGIHLSRIGEEVVLFSTAEFGFMRLDDAWATGSSMLPQKKNPDVAELARGKAGRLVGNLVGFLTTLKGLPLAYNRDLQEDKEPLFDAIDQVTLALVAMEGLMGTVTFDTERMQQAADGPSLVAVDLAEWLVARGVPFRDAHGTVAALVRESVERHVPIAELIEAHPAFGEEALTLLEPGSALRRHRSAGGTGPDAVALQMQRFVGRVEIDAARLSSWTR
jgi:argininosuccinate lyase